MVTTIMRMFGGYTIERLLDTPIVHVAKLYDMAERASSLSRYDILVGTIAQHDSNMSKGLQQVASQNTIADRDKMRELNTQANRNRALANVAKLEAQLNGGKV